MAESATVTSDNPSTFSPAFSDLTNNTLEAEKSRMQLDSYLDAKETTSFPSSDSQTVPQDGAISSGTLTPGSNNSNSSLDSGSFSESSPSTPEDSIVPIPTNECAPRGQQSASRKRVAQDSPEHGKHEAKAQRVSEQKKIFLAAAENEAQAAKEQSFQDDDDNNNNKNLSLSQPPYCRNCGTTETCRWRYGPEGRRTLCNACHLRWKMREKRRQERGDAAADSAAKRRPTTPKAAPKRKASKMNANKQDHLMLDGTTENSPGAEVAQQGTETSAQDPQLLRNRKEFLIAGMYSSTYKAHSKPSRVTKAALAKRLAKRNDGSSSSPRFSFPLPIHQGTFIIGKERDFELPPDIMQEYKLGLFGRAPITLPKPNFMRIRSNIFVERKPKTGQSVVCQCKPPSDGSLGCGEDCLNRMMFYECDPATCPCKEQCSNQRFRRNEYIKELEPFPTRERGWGLRTLVDIKKGTLITEYRGEVISQQTCEERMRTVYKDQKNFYFFDYRNGEVLDASTKGSDARFINHSCEPNCHIEKWSRGGELHVGIFASQDIPANSELFYDYNFYAFNNGAGEQTCHCGSANCRGTIGRKSDHQARS